MEREWERERDQRIALQNVVNCLDDETGEICLPSKLSVLNHEMNRKVSKLMEMKQTLFSMEDKLKQFRANQKEHTEKIS